MDSLCILCEIAAQSLRNCCAFELPSLCNHIVYAVQFVRNRCAFAVQLPCDCFTHYSLFATNHHLPSTKHSAPHTSYGYLDIGLHFCRCAEWRARCQRQPARRSLRGLHRCLFLRRGALFLQQRRRGTIGEGRGVRGERPRQRFRRSVALGWHGELLLDSLIFRISLYVTIAWRLHGDKENMLHSLLAFFLSSSSLLEFIYNAFIL
jgi:hypothetical protein